MQIVGFVARRLLAERIVIVCAARAGTGEDVLAGLPELRIGGLDEDSARALLLDNVYGPLDARVCERILAESHGNPLALLELPRTATASDLAGGFGLPDAHRVTGRIERSYARRLDMLPSKTQLLVLAAAAEPLGDPVLLHRAAATLDTDIAAVNPAVDAGLITVDTRVEFAHPIVRTVVYRSATAHDRERSTAPSRRPPSASTPTVATGTAPTPRSARTRTSPPSSRDRRAGRGLAAGSPQRLPSSARRDALTRSSREVAARARGGGGQAAGGSSRGRATLLASAVAGPLDELETALAQRRRGLIAIDLRRPGRRSVPPRRGRPTRVDEPRLARRRTWRRCEQRASAVASPESCSPLPPRPLAARLSRRVPRAVDLLVDGLALRFSGDYVSSAGPLSLRSAPYAMRTTTSGRTFADPVFRRCALALDLFDDDACDTLATRSVQLAREQGALGVLPLALHHLAQLPMLRRLSRRRGVAGGRVRRDRRCDGTAAFRGRTPDACRLPRR